jgi:hypothetical protein
MLMPSYFLTLTFVTIFIGANSQIMRIVPQSPMNHSTNQIEIQKIYLQFSSLCHFLTVSQLESKTRRSTIPTIQKVT